VNLKDLRPYTALKDSQLPWLGSVPASWRIARNGTLFAQRNETGFGDLPILEVSLKTGVRVRNMGTGRKQVMADRGKYKRACRHDLAYNMMRMWQGAIGLAPVDGLVSPAYVVARALPNVEPRYFEYLFRTDAYMGEVDKFSHGIVKDRNRLYWEEFKQMPSPVPPREEQVGIVRFLDHASRRIGRCIRGKQRLIALLEEHKTAIIRRAVARGLNPTTRLRPSGVEWLGDVPEHWVVTRVKAVFECLNRRRVPLSTTQRGAMKARLYDYYGASGVIDRVEDYLFDDELLLLAEDGANLVLRNLPLAITARGKFWVNNHAHILKPKGGSLDFLASVMESLNYLPWITGAAQPKLTQDRLMSIAIAVPPRDEQEAVVAGVRNETALLRASIERSRLELSLLAEYRKRLIADVVTGVFDVQGAAAQLADDDGEDEAEMGAEDSMEDDGLALDAEAVSDGAGW
jgi:type I restriction enzyme S subunit